MPEGDNLFRAATALGKALRGARVVRFRSDVPLVRRAAEEKPVEGRLVAGVAARGKHLLIRFDDARILRTHLRMRGSWHLYRSGEAWQRPEHRARVAIETDSGFVAVCFDAPLVQLGSEFGMRDLEELGPDATTDQFDSAEAVHRIRAGADLTIGEALLVQRAVAGIGNVIKAEALFLSGQDPFQRVGEIAADRLAAIVDEAHRLLVANRESGPRTSRRALSGPSLWVYGRSGKPCLRCGTKIVMRRQGALARSTYYCPRCQLVPS
ncbi:MAG TPA: DNA-formamidopyrimidine glycosylase family protein [Myxococcales bacterium]|nr:DNA-formamidopyrimidine glycosylase family protein [Myxococcales bacterium]